jgi:hypothetical protein
MKALPELRLMQAAVRAEREHRDGDIASGYPVPATPAPVHQAPDQDDQDARDGTGYQLLLGGFADLSRLLLLDF